MSPGPTFERVYRELKAQLVQGRFAPGAQLEPAAIGEELCSSITPVRDALHRLVGERLVEAPRGDGFTVPLLTEFAVRSLYGWSGELVGLALRRRGSVARPAHVSESSESPGQPASSALLLADLLAALVRDRGTAEHHFALVNANDRLGPFRAVEPAVLPDLEGELHHVETLASSGDPSPLRRAMTAYHRRRIRAVTALVEAVQRRG